MSAENRKWICSIYKSENITFLWFSGASQHGQEKCLCLTEGVGWTSGSHTAVPRPVVSASPDICSYLLLCRKSLPNFVALNTNKLVLFHTVSVGQEFKSDLAGWTWRRVSHEVAVKVLPRAEVIWRLNWGWKLMLKEREWVQEQALSWNHVPSHPSNIVRIESLNLVHVQKDKSKAPSFEVRDVKEFVDMC